MANTMSAVEGLQVLKAGLALEEKLGTNASAALIYIASDPSMNYIPNWFTDNREVLQDMERLAVKESGEAVHEKRY